ncbi:MAG: hypothetical protein WCY41_06030 [Candidatus Micrarchaeia archaeon]
MHKTTGAFVLPAGVDGKQLMELKSKLSKCRLQAIKEQTGKGDFGGLLPLLARTDGIGADMAPAAKQPKTKGKDHNGTVELHVPAAPDSMERPPGLPKSWRESEHPDESFSALYNVKDLYLAAALPQSLIKKFAKELKASGVLSPEHAMEFKAVL